MASHTKKMVYLYLTDICVMSSIILGMLQTRSFYWVEVRVKPLDEGDYVWGLSLYHFIPTSAL